MLRSVRKPHEQGTRVADKKLQEIRERIDGVDQPIVSALADRQKLALEGDDGKLRAGLPLKDAAREEQKLAELGTFAGEVGASPHLVRKVFREVMDFTLRFEQHRVLGRDNADELPGQRHLIVA